MNWPETKAAATSGRLIPNPKAKLRDQCHEVARFKHLAERTEDAYWQWVVRFLKFHRRGGQWRHPRDLPPQAVAEFLSDLATRLKVAAGTQNQALNALIFLYREVLHQPFDQLGPIERPRRPPRVPVVLSRAEVGRLLEAMDGTLGLVARLLYGSGLRLMEGLRLRVKDVDFERGQIVVHDGKGFKDRVTVLPESLPGPLTAHLKRVEGLHQRDLKAGPGGAQSVGWMNGSRRRK